MPYTIGGRRHQASTLAMRQTRGAGTILCSTGDGRLAAGKGPDGRYYCKYHLQKIYGFLPGVS